MKKIAYIELDTHAELAANFYELTKDSADISVDFYFSEKIFKLLNIRDKNIHITDYSDLLDILNKKKYDLIIIGTVHRHFIFYKAIVKRYNTAVLVHNLNFSKASKWDLFKSIFRKDFKYRLKLLLKEGLLEAPNVYQKAKNILAIDKKMSEKYQFKFLPLYRYNASIGKLDQLLDHQIIKIVIPGAVSQRRRDYDSLFEKLKNFKDNGLFYEFIFLGKASGKELEKLKHFEKFKLQNIKFQYFTDKIPQDQFDKKMSTADLLYCPIQPETDFFSVKEFYGKTKASGNIGDAIKYGKPAIFPASYPSDLDFIVEETSDLQEQITELFRQNFDFSSYSKEHVSQDLVTLLNQL